MITVQIAWQQLAINCLIGWAVTTFASYVIITAYERISELKINRRIKALLPVVIAIVAYYFLGSGTVWMKIIIGFVIGTAATSFYQWFVDKLLSAMDGIYGVALDKIKDKIRGSGSGGGGDSPPNNPPTNTPPPPAAPAV